MDKMNIIKFMSKNGFNCINETKIDRWIDSLEFIENIDSNKVQKIQIRYSKDSKTYAYIMQGRRDNTYHVGEQNIVGLRNLKKTMLSIFEK